MTTVHCDGDDCTAFDAILCTFVRLKNIKERGCGAKIVESVWLREGNNTQWINYGLIWLIWFAWSLQDNLKKDKKLRKACFAGSVYNANLANVTNYANGSSAGAKNIELLVCDKRGGRRRRRERMGINTPLDDCAARYRSHRNHQRGYPKVSLRLMLWLGAPSKSVCYTEGTLTGAMRGVKSWKQAFDVLS